MFKKMFLKKMVQSQLKGLPADQQEKILKLIEENPELFTKVAKEVQAKVKEGKPQQAAMMEVFKANEAELKKVLGK